MQNIFQKNKIKLCTKYVFKIIEIDDEDVDTNFEKPYNVIENIIEDSFDDHKHKKNEIRHDIFNFGYHEFNDYYYYYNIYEKCMMNILEILFVQYI